MWLVSEAQDADNGTHQRFALTAAVPPNLHDIVPNAGTEIERAQNASAEGVSQLQRSFPQYCCVAATEGFLRVCPSSPPPPPYASSHTLTPCTICTRSLLTHAHIFAHVHSFDTDIFRLIYVNREQHKDVNEFVKRSRRLHSIL